MIDAYQPDIPISRQCELLSVSRSAYYYHCQSEDIYNELLMRLMDEEYTRHPFYGSRRLAEWLKREGHDVNRKRVRRLMKLMGIEAIYQKPRLSTSDKEHENFPYLLKGLVIDHPNQVWCADITYIRMQRGFIYLIAIMDWFSRYVLSSEVSISLEKDFCMTALDKAMKSSKPEIFNTDQGVQFTSNDFVQRLKNAEIAISMDGRGRVFDNIFIERLWRSLKYEEVYLNDYVSVKEAIARIKRYFEYYNNERPHQSLVYKTPSEFYC